MNKKVKPANKITTITLIPIKVKIHYGDNASFNTAIKDIHGILSQKCHGSGGGFDDNDNPVHYSYEISPQLNGLE